MDHAKIEEKLIGLSTIKVGKNHRALDNGPEMKELVESVKTHGIIHRLAVRATEDPSTFELIAGNRRFHAAQKAKLLAAPALIYPADTTDAEAELIQAAENLDRKPLNPIEEANAINAVALRFPDMKTVGAMVNRSVRYVERALSLLSLPEIVKEQISLGNLTAAHGHHIMRAGGKQRESLAEFVTKKTYEGGLPTVTELVRYISSKIDRDLERASFPKDVEYAGEIACARCPQNTANQGALFDGATAGTCTGPTCFAKKERAYLKEFEEKQGAKFAKLKPLGVISGPDYKGEIKGGFKALSEADLKNKDVKKAMEENPDAFVWAIQKPSRYGEAKPKVVVAVVDPSVLPKSMAPLKEKENSGEDWEKNRYIEKAVGLALLEVVAKKFTPENPKVSHLQGMVLRRMMGEDVPHIKVRLFSIYGEEAIKDVNDEKDVEKFVQKMTRPELIHALFVYSFERIDDDVLPLTAKEMGVDVKKIVGNAKASASKLWDDEKKKELDNVGADK